LLINVTETCGSLCQRLLQVVTSRPVAAAQWVEESINYL